MGQPPPLFEGAGMPMATTLVSTDIVLTPSILELKSVLLSLLKDIV